MTVTVLGLTLSMMYGSANTGAMAMDITGPLLSMRTSFDVCSTLPAMVAATLNEYPSAVA